MNDLGPIVDLRLKLTKAEKKIERLTAENKSLGTDLRDTTLVLEAHRQTHERLRTALEDIAGATDAQLIESTMACLMRVIASKALNPDD